MRRRELQCVATAKSFARLSVSRYWSFKMATPCMKYRVSHGFELKNNEK